MVRAFRSCIVLVLLSLSVTAAQRGAVAQDTLRAAIIVNDEVISELELTMRLRLALVSSGLQETPETRQRLQPQVVRALVDELLQEQEARRLGIAVDETRVQETFARIAENNNLSAEQLARALLSVGILPDYLMDQVRAQLTWQAVVQRRLRPEVQIAEEEIDEAVARLETTRDQPQRLLAEIFLAIDNVTQEATVREQARELHTELQRGASFQAVARQFSQSASAASGGDLGWVEPGQLPVELEQGIADLRPGQLSGPIETLNGIYIILVRDQRAPPESEITVTLKQIFFPVRERTQKELERAALRAIEAGKAVTGCANVEEVAEKMQSPGTVDLGIRSFQDLPANMRQVLADLPIGQASQPIEVPGGISTIVICDRQDGGINRDRVEERLTIEKLEVLARRYMRDLRRSANIELRI